MDCFYLGYLLLSGVFASISGDCFYVVLASLVVLCGKPLFRFRVFFLPFSKIDCWIAKTLDCWIAGRMDFVALLDC